MSTVVVQSNINSGRVPCVDYSNAEEKFSDIQFTWTSAATSCPPRGSSRMDIVSPVRHFAFPTQNGEKLFCDLTLRRWSYWKLNVQKRSDSLHFWTNRQPTTPCELNLPRKRYVIVTQRDAETLRHFSSWWRLCLYRTSMTRECKPVGYFSAFFVMMCR